MEEILEYLGFGAEERIYAEYLGFSPQAKKYYVNPLTASNGKTLKFYNSRGRLRHRDYNPSHDNYRGDCFDMAQRALNCDIKTAIQDIKCRFNIIEGNKPSKIDYKKYTRKEKDVSTSETVIDVELQPYREYDIEYWKSFKVLVNLLPRYEIKSARRIKVNGKTWNFSHPTMPLFAYIIQGLVKGYCPLTDNPAKKWISNTPKDIIVDYDKLPEKVDKLVIASGKKDQMVALTCGYHTVHTGGEGIWPEDMREKILAKTDNPIILFDPDDAGIAGANKLKLEMPEAKIFTWGDIEWDLAEFSFHNNINVTKNFLERQLGKPSIKWKI